MRKNSNNQLMAGYCYLDHFEGGMPVNRLKNELK